MTITPEQARHLIAAVKNDKERRESHVCFSPWTLDGTVSTDGRLLIHVANDLGFPPVPMGNGDMPSFTSKLLTEGYGDAVSVPMPRLRAWAGEPAGSFPCMVCEKLPGICWKCKGKKTEECYHCGHDMDCEDCDGKGVCGTCDGLKSVEDATERPGMHGGICVNRTLLAPAVARIPADIDNVTVSVRGDTPGILRIQGDGWTVCLASMREHGGEQLLGGGS